MQLLMLMNTTPHYFKIVLSIAPLLALTACSTQIPETLVTFADARTLPAQASDIGEAGDSVGDILTFDQPLLDADMNAIGNNSGFCIRTRVAHSFQCQWTLMFDNGGIQVAGREFDQGTSTISIVGGTGDFAGITGDMESTNTGDGLFRQVLRYRLTR
jgi:hypothetical protein